MERRRFLAFVPLAVVGGCTARPPVSTERDGPSTCPEPIRLPPERTDVVCTQTTGNGMQMGVSEKSVSLPGAAVEFELTNTRGEALHGNHTQWQLFKLERSRWNLVTPHSSTANADGLQAGDTWKWSLVVDNDGLSESIGERHPSSRTIHLRLGGGTYAFGHHGRFEGTESSDFFVTRFHIEGAQLPLVPTDDVRDVRRRNRFVEVDTGPPDAEERAVLSVTRTGDAPTLGRADVSFDLTPEWASEWVALTTETLYADDRRWQPRLRDALSQFDEGVETVRVVARTSCCPPLGLRRRTWSVTYGGDAYEVERK